MSTYKDNQKKLDIVEVNLGKLRKLSKKIEYKHKEEEYKEMVQNIILLIVLFLCLFTGGAFVIWSRKYDREKNDLKNSY